jgi:F-type H+-transporting ATPase subunit b
MFKDPETWVAISFLLFAALLIYFKVPGKLAKSLDTRSSAIARELEEARKLRQEAEAILADYKRRTENAQSEAAAIISQAETDALAYANEARAAFDEMIARRLNIAEQKIKLEEEKARKQIRAQAAELAIAAAEQLIEQKVSGKIAENMITASLDRIKKRLHYGASANTDICWSVKPLRTRLLQLLNRPGNAIQGILIGCRGSFRRGSLDNHRAAARHGRQQFALFRRVPRKGFVIIGHKRKILAAYGDDRIRVRLHRITELNAYLVANAVFLPGRHVEDDRGALGGLRLHIGWRGGCKADATVRAFINKDGPILDLFEQARLDAGGARGRRLFRRGRALRLWLCTLGGALRLRRLGCILWRRGLLRGGKRGENRDQRCRQKQARLHAQIPISPEALPIINLNASVKPKLL